MPTRDIVSKVHVPATRSKEIKVADAGLRDDDRERLMPMRSLAAGLVFVFGKRRLPANCDWPFASVAAGFLALDFAAFATSPAPRLHPRKPIVNHAALPLVKAGRAASRVRGAASGCTFPPCCRHRNSRSGRACAGGGSLAQDAAAPPAAVPEQQSQRSEQPADARRADRFRHPSHARCDRRRGGHLELGQSRRSPRRSKARSARRSPVRRRVRRSGRHSPGRLPSRWWRGGSVRGGRRQARPSIRSA